MACAERLGNGPRVLDKVPNRPGHFRVGFRSVPAIGDYPDADPDNTGIDDDIGSLGGPTK